MKNLIHESNEVPIIDTYDVIVVGGGIAAVGAALAARRQGCSVLIIEKSVMLGGLATLGFIAYYLPLCDGNGKKVSGGIAEELLHLSIKYGYGDLDPQWETDTISDPKKRYMTKFSPPEFIYAMDELVLSEKIDVLFDTVFCKPVIENGVCQAIIVENKSGRTAYKAKMFIDSTGDGDLLARAGADFVEEENYLAYWYYCTNLEAMEKAVAAGSVKKGVLLRERGMFRKDGTYNMGEREYKGTDAKDVTRFIFNGRKIMKEQIDKNQSENGSLIAIPGMAQFRRTRSITGLHRLTEEDAMKPFDDSIGVTGHWLKPGIVYEIPYRILVNHTIGNVFASGRAVSAGGDAWEAVRVIPPAVITGQAAGTAAAIAIRKQCKTTEVSISELQAELKKADVILHY